MTVVSIDLDRLPLRLRAAGWMRPLQARGAFGDGGAAIAIVGSRAATHESMDHAHVLARHLAGRGVRVVSGGALGIDGAAHRGALAGGGATTVVLGSGIDVAYPKRHAPLFEQIVARGGALVSMFPRGMQPRRATFPARNPLIAAFADAVVVVAADLRSGSLSTAHAARRFGRVVAAWPGTAGTDRLIATGAAIVEGIADLDALLAGTPRMPAPRTPAALDPIAARVAAALHAGARGVDGVVAATGLGVRDVLRALPLLEGTGTLPGRTS